MHENSGGREKNTALAYSAVRSYLPKGNTCYLHSSPLLLHLFSMDTQESNGRRLGTSTTVHTGSATTNVASRVGLAIAGEHLTEAIQDPRSLSLIARHLRGRTRDVILPPQLDFPTSTAGLQRDSATRARSLSEFAEYMTTIIKLCQLDLREEDLRSRVETVAVAQLVALQSSRTKLALADCLPEAPRRLAQQLRSADLFTDEDRRLIAISGEVLHAGAHANQHQPANEPSRSFSSHYRGRGRGRGNQRRGRP